MIISNNIIQKVVVEIDIKAKSKSTFEIQNIISKSIKKIFYENEADILSNVDIDNKYFRIDKLEIDIGKINLNNIENELKKKIVNAIKNKLILKENLSKYNKNLLHNFNDFETLSYFLSNGYFPWWIVDKTLLDFDNYFSKYCQKNTDIEINKFLEKLFLYRKNIFEKKRFLEQISVNTLNELLKRILSNTKKVISLSPNADFQTKSVLFDLIFSISDKQEDFFYNQINKQFFFKEAGNQIKILHLSEFKLNNKNEKAFFYQLKNALQNYKLTLDNNINQTNFILNNSNNQEYRHKQKTHFSVNETDDNFKKVVDLIDESLKYTFYKNTLNEQFNVNHDDKTKISLNLFGFDFLYYLISQYFEFKKFPIWSEKLISKIKIQNKYISDFEVLIVFLKHLKTNFAVQINSEIRKFINKSNDAIDIFLLQKNDFSQLLCSIIYFSEFENFTNFKLKIIKFLKVNYDLDDFFISSYLNKIFVYNFSEVDNLLKIKLLNKSDFNNVINLLNIKSITNLQNFEFIKKFINSEIEKSFYNIQIFNQLIYNFILHKSFSEIKKLENILKSNKSNNILQYIDTKNIVSLLKKIYKSEYHLISDYISILIETIKLLDIKNFDLEYFERFLQEITFYNFQKIDNYLFVLLLEIDKLIDNFSHFLFSQIKIRGIEKFKYFFRILKNDKNLFIRYINTKKVKSRTQKENDTYKDYSDYNFLKNIVKITEIQNIIHYYKNYESQSIKTFKIYLEKGKVNNFKSEFLTNQTFFNENDYTFLFENDFKISDKFIISKIFVDELLKVLKSDIYEYNILIKDKKILEELFLFYSNVNYSISDKYVNIIINYIDINIIEKLLLKNKLILANDVVIRRISNLSDAVSNYFLKIFKKSNLEYVEYSRHILEKLINISKKQQWQKIIYKKVKEFYYKYLLTIKEVNKIQYTIDLIYFFSKIANIDFPKLINKYIEKSEFPAEIIKILKKEDLKFDKSNVEENKIEKSIPTDEKTINDIIEEKNDAFFRTFPVESKEELYQKLLEEKFDWLDNKKDGEKIYIQNAGLVLLWVFLPNLFLRLKLTEKADNKTQFVNFAAHEKAVLLTQFLFCEKTEMPENELVLNKILCGFPVQNPITKKLDITDEEKKECQMLLNSAIKHWKILGNTTIEGLRQNFMKREGILVYKNKSWNVKVEQKAIDILIQKIPWTFQTIKLSWNPYFIFVDWNV